jgi:plastocyanin
MRRFRVRAGVFFAVALTVPALTLLSGSASLGASSRGEPRHEVLIPAADKFVPYHLTIHVGDRVTWVNNDTDDHTVVSDDAFNTEGHHGLDHLILGTDGNGGKPGTFTLKFTHTGTFVYYCRFHAHLDADSQPVAPGPDGGIQDANGNFGTPMNGIISVTRSHDDRSHDDKSHDDKSHDDKSHDDN